MTLNPHFGEILQIVSLTCAAFEQKDPEGQAHPQPIPSSCLPEDFRTVPRVSIP